MEDRNGIGSGVENEPERGERVQNKIVLEPSLPFFGVDDPRPGDSHMLGKFSLGETEIETPASYQVLDVCHAPDLHPTILTPLHRNVNAWLHCSECERLATSYRPLRPPV